MTLKECTTLKEIFPTTIFSVKLMHDCIKILIFYYKCNPRVTLNSTEFDILWLSPNKAILAPGNYTSAVSILKNDTLVDSGGHWAST